MRKLWPLVPLIAVVAISFIAILGALSVALAGELSAENPQITTQTVEQEASITAMVKEINDARSRPFMATAVRQNEAEESPEYAQTNGQLKIDATYQTKIEANARTGPQYETACGSDDPNFAQKKNADAANTEKIEVTARSDCYFDDAVQSDGFAKNDADAPQTTRIVLRL